MKVDTSRLKKGTSEVPTECQTLIDKLRSCSMDELLDELRKVDTWTFGKSELYHWIDVLDIFDGILEEATKQIGNDWFLACDERFAPKKIQLLLAVLNFTTLLIEHSFSRHLYNSVEHLTQLLSSTNMEIVLGVLNLLYMFSKRSNFIPRLNCAKRNALLARLTYIAEVSAERIHKIKPKTQMFIVQYSTLSISIFHKSHETELGRKRAWLWTGRMLPSINEDHRVIPEILLRILRQRWQIEINRTR